MLKRLRTRLKTLTKYRDGGSILTSTKADLGLKVRVIDEKSIWANQIGMIIDHEHTKKPLLLMEKGAVIFIDINDLQIWDDKEVIERPSANLASYQLLEGIKYLKKNMVKQPKYLVASRLTTRHLLLHDTDFLDVDKTIATLTIGSEKVSASLSVKGIPLVDKLPNIVVERTLRTYTYLPKMPHFVVTSGDDFSLSMSNVIFLNPEIVKPDMPKEEKADTNDLLKAMLTRKKNATWNF
jgi:hypothetical protein